MIVVIFSHFELHGPRPRELKLESCTILVDMNIDDSQWLFTLEWGILSMAPTPHQENHDYPNLYKILEGL